MHQPSAIGARFAPCDGPFELLLAFVAELNQNLSETESIQLARFFVWLDCVDGCAVSLFSLIVRVDRLRHRGRPRNE
jgi:hypothetical protein